MYNLSMRRILSISVFVIVLLLIMFFLQNLFRSKENKSPEPNNRVVKAYINGSEYELEIADTVALRTKGLMYREQMDVNKGMLFVFEKENIYPFWMKNTYIPLDIIWLNKNKEVVFIGEDVKPCTSKTGLKCDTVIPNAKAAYVVELNSGQTKEMDLQLTDKFEFNLD